MHSKDQNDWNELEHAAFVAQVGDLHLGPAISEERLVGLLSDALREPSPLAKAQLLVDIANMSMALADKTLGAQDLVATSVVLTRH